MNRKIKFVSLKDNNLENYYEKLVNSGYASVIVSNFLTKQECKEIVSELSNPSEFLHFDGVIRHIGPFLSAFVAKKEEYFNESKKFIQESKLLFPKSILLHQKILAFLKMSTSLTVQTASELQNQYSPFVIRFHGLDDFVPIHKDIVSHSAKGFLVSLVSNQISCVLHLQTAQKGGELVIYEQKWVPKDEQYRKIGFGYSEEVITTKKSLLIKPKTGDLIMLNPSFFHRILPIHGSKSRITMSCFAGNLSNKLIVWA